MRTQSLLVFAVSALAIASFPVVQAQEPAADKPALTLKVKSREVLLPVTVRDKKGAVIANLKAADFTLTEDGRPQTIKSFLHDSNLPFRIGLLCDTSRSMSASLEAERKASEKFVDQMLPTGPANTKKDQAFLIHFDRQVELLQDFTASPEKLHRELDDMSATRGGGGGDQGPETTGDDRGDNGGNGGYGGRGQGQGSGQRRNHGGTQLYDAIFLASDELMKPQSGRKALVVFSDGADRASKETLSDAMDAAEHADVVIYTIYFKGEQERSGSMPGMGNGRHGGMGGGGYPGGGSGWPGGSGGGSGRRGGGSDEPAIDGKKIMEKIAQRTGGRFFEAKKKENLEEIYNQIAEDLRAQYLLTYTPDLVDKEGGYHKIVLKPGKDDWQVFTRPGYYAQEEK